MPLPSAEPVRSVLAQFESGGFWSCRALNKWLLVVVTLALGILPGAPLIYEYVVEQGVPIYLALVGVLSIACAVLLWVRVTYAVPVGMAILVLTLFTDELVYQFVVAVLLAGLTAQTSTRTFRVWTLVFMLLWAAVHAVVHESISLLECLGIGGAVMAAYAIGAAFRKTTTARLQSRSDLERLEAKHTGLVATKRKQIAQDLHDIVAHDITIIALQARAAQINDTNEDYREAVKIIGDSSRTVLKDLRRVLTLLQDDDGPGPEELGSSASELDVRRGCTVFAQRLEGLGIAVEQNISGDLDTLSRSASAAMYRMLQECTTNVIKYAGTGAACWIEIIVGHEHVTMCVTNTVLHSSQGREEWSPSGAGLIGIRDRAAAFGGTAETGLDDQGRWRVRVLDMKKA